MYKVNQRLNILYWRFRDNPVSEIKDVTRPAIHFIKHFLSFTLNLSFICTKYDGVHITLH